MQRKKPAGQQRATGADFTGHPVARAPPDFRPSNSHFDHGGGDASDMTAWPAACLYVSQLVCPGWGRCLALLIQAGVASLCAQPRGEPSSAHCEQRLSERLTPCPCNPVCACTGIRGQTGKGRKAGQRCNEKRNGSRISARAPTRSAASRAGMAGWAGEGGGRFGERREYEAPTLPSTPRQHGAARHHTSQATSGTPPQKPVEKQHAMPTQHGSPPPKQAHKPRRQPQNTPGQNENGCFRPALPVSASRRPHCAAGPAQPPQPAPTPTAATSPRRRPSGRRA